MSKSLFPVILCASLVLSGSQAADNITNVADKQQEGRVFSIFSVVQFKNQGCRSQSTMTSGQSPQRNGTCFTSSECSSKGGTASGNCASGFGVCCLFLVSTAGSTINQNCTYLRNPGFPTTLTGTTSLTYTVNKCAPDVCFLRLDFETFQIVGPTDTQAVANTCPDALKITSTTSQAVPQICGLNTGQHVYVDIGNQATDTATLSFTFSSTIAGTPATSRQWEIKISQIGCSNPNRPPQGCLQYFTTPTGRISTFNFFATSSAKLNSQNYNICIRQAAGFCCNRYVPCQGVTNAFTINADPVAGNMGQTDTLCSLDYVLIPGSSLTCSYNSNNLHTRFCGNYLGPILADSSMPGVVNTVCDCTTPFVVGVNTNGALDSAANVNRGVCLDYQQEPCQRV